MCGFITWNSVIPTRCDRHVWARGGRLRPRAVLGRAGEVEKSQVADVQSAAAEHPVPNCVSVVEAGRQLV